MKVLVTHELFPPDFAGGGETTVYNLVSGIKNKGIDIKVLTTGNPKIKTYKSIQTIRLPINRYLMNFSSSAVEKHAKDVDIIHANNYNGCLASYYAGKKLNKPVICFVHGVYGDKWIDMRGPIFGTLSKWIEKFQLNKNYKKIIFYSNFSRDMGLKIGIPKNKTKIITPGIDYKKYYTKKKENFVLFVGRLSKQKGLDYLLKAARRLPYITFKIVGDGEEKERLKSMAPINVEFLGFKKGKSLYDLYAKASIFCLPSICESFGLVILQAMASGCAIISTVKPVKFNGYHIKSKNVDDIVKTVDKLFKNPKKTKSMGKQNRKIVKKYTWKNFVKEFKKLYEKIIE